MQPHSAATTASTRSQHVLDPADPRALSRGLCNFCGDSVPRGKIYCGTWCRVMFWRLAMARARTIYVSLLLWRKHRGRQGTPGQGAISDVQRAVDRWLAEDLQDAERRRARKPARGGRIS